MNQKYTDCVEQISQILFEALAVGAPSVTAKREEDLTAKIS